jgi:hypothetical protein
VKVVNVTRKQRYAARTLLRLDEHWGNPVDRYVQGVANAEPRTDAAVPDGEDVGDDSEVRFYLID